MLGVDCKHEQCHVTSPSSILPINIVKVSVLSLKFFLEPKPVYAQPGQPDVDLPVSPSDAPVPSAAHDDSILR